ALVAGDLLVARVVVVGADEHLAARHDGTAVCLRPEVGRPLDAGSLHRIELVRDALVGEVHHVALHAAAVERPGGGGAVFFLLRFVALHGRAVGGDDHKDAGEHRGGQPGDEPAAKWGAGGGMHDRYSVSSVVRSP